MDEKNLKIGIIGAGIQGVCNALFLQKKGFQVTLFDREEPGCAASYGNAGHFSPYASVPLNRPDVIADVPSMLISSRGPLALKWNYVPKMIPWFARFILNCREEKMMHTAKNMHQILDQSLPAFDELFDEINLEGLVENNGILYVWTDQNMKSRELEIRIRDQLGVKQQLVNKKEIHDLEPNLKPFYHGGVFYDYARHARNPRKILIKLFENFVNKGGKFLKLNIQDIDFDEEKPVLRTETQRFILNCREEKMMHTAKNMHQILDQSLPAFDELFDEINLDGLVENNGILYVWTDQNMKSRELEIQIRDDLGVKQQVLIKKKYMIWNQI